MPEIVLTQGKFAIVDDDDYEVLNQWKWCFDGRYATHEHKGKTLFMHRAIMQTPSGLVTDHIDGNKLDNRKSNLRICTNAQNIQNKTVHSCNNTSGFKGVSFNKRYSKWCAFIGYKGKRINIGSFPTPDACARAYDTVAKELFGEFAKLNFIE